jgi:hypothetical protein
MARMTAYFASKAGKIAGAESSRKFLLWRSYGDNSFSSNEIEQMASYRSYSATGPLIDRKKRITSTSSSPRAVRRKAHRFLGQKMALRYLQAYLVLPSTRIIKECLHDRPTRQKRLLCMKSPLLTIRRQYPTTKVISSHYPPP